MHESNPGVSDEQIAAYISAVIEAGCINVAADAKHLFTQRSGRRSWAYIDQARLLCQPKTFGPCLEMLGSYLSHNFPPADTILVNADSKFSPHTTGALAARLGYRQIVINPAATTEAENGVNLRLRLPHSVKPSDSFVIVDDTLTSGGTVIDIVELVRAELKSGPDEAQFHLAVCLLRGEPKATEQRLTAAGISMHWFTDMPTLAGQITTLNPAQRAGLNAEPELSAH